MRVLCLFILWVGLASDFSTARYQVESDSTSRRFFIGTSAFMVGNLFPDPPSFFQINVGYQLTDRDVISVEAITWTYKHPLGIPYGSDFGSDDYEYPGFIREYGIGLAYQRYWWKGLYTAAHAVPFVQKYVDEEGDKIQNGFQLFTTFRVGYHVELFGNRFFIEPSIAATHWPINTNTPESFAALERPWPNYFLFEPGFHIGFKF
jgi:hypothetical protein